MVVKKLFHMRIVLQNESMTDYMELLVIVIIFIYVVATLALFVAVLST